jgi:hypothetical protein
MDERCTGRNRVRTEEREGNKKSAALSLPDIAARYVSGGAQRAIMSVGQASHSVWPFWSIAGRSLVDRRSIDDRSTIDRRSADDRPTIGRPREH